MKDLFEVTYIATETEQKVVVYVASPDAAKAAAAVTDGKVTNVRSLGECIVVAK